MYDAADKIKKETEEAERKRVEEERKKQDAETAADEDVRVHI